MPLTDKLVNPADTTSRAAPEKLIIAVLLAGAETSVSCAGCWTTDSVPLNACTVLSLMTGPTITVRRWVRIFVVCSMSAPD